MSLTKESSRTLLYKKMSHISSVLYTPPEYIGHDTYLRMNIPYPALPVTSIGRPSPFPGSRVVVFKVVLVVRESQSYIQTLS